MSVAAGTLRPLHSSPHLGASRRLTCAREQTLAGIVATMPGLIGAAALSWR